MISSLGTILAKNIMTKLQKAVINPWQQDDLTKRSLRYVDATILWIKQKNMYTVLQNLNFFDIKLEFAVGFFTDSQINTLIH